MAGFNVHSIALQIPKSRLTEGGDPVIGVWATTYRRAQRVLTLEQARRAHAQGGWVQVARLGHAAGQRGRHPARAEGQVQRHRRRATTRQFAASVLNPELAGLIPVLYPGVKVPTSVDLGLGLGGREDIATIFLTGIPGVNQPKNVDAVGDAAAEHVDGRPRPSRTVAR